MCGITGFVNNRKKCEKEQIIKKMSDRIIHRGPDSEGYFCDDLVAFGFRRLSIIDLEGGSQPIFNDKKDKVIIFNGEIYNYLELKKELSKKYKFKTKTDTEVILRGYEEYGKNIVKKLRGMFSFAIYDVKKKEVFGARDPFGIKPYYYGIMNDTFMFSSEIKSFLDSPDFIKEFNEKALKPYLTFQFSALNETFFKNVYKLKPGHYYTYKNGKLDIKEYYDTVFKSSNKKEEEYKEQIKTVMKDSIKKHKISDVKVGSFLSGGVDSSYIVKSLMPEKTYSVGFKRKYFDETSKAKELSKKLKIENVSNIITPDDFFKSLESVAYHSDEPHANPSAVPLYHLASLASKDVKVVLSGEGADEMFGGYEVYALDKYDLKYRKTPKFIRYAAGKVAYHLPRFHGRKFLIKNGLPVEQYFTGSSKIFEEKEKKSVLKKEYLNSYSYKEITKPFFDKVKDCDETTKMQYVDLHLWMLEDINLKADKMTMANSLELRVPFLDKEVMEVARKIPTEYKIKNNTTKNIFREAAADILPDEWAKREKLGFPVPFHHWIREEKYYKIVKKEFEQDYVTKFFKKDGLDKLLSDHLKSKENGRKIYTIYMFLLWYKVYFIKEGNKQC